MSLACSANHFCSLQCWQVDNECVIVSQMASSLRLFPLHPGAMHSMSSSSSSLSLFAYRILQYNYYGWFRHHPFPPQPICCHLLLLSPRCPEEDMASLHCMLSSPSPSQVSTLGLSYMHVLMSRQINSQITNKYHIMPENIQFD